MFKLKKRRPSADMPPAKRIDKTGLAPGALIHLGERKTEEATISLLEYGVDALFEHRFTSIAEADAYQPRLPVIWLNVHGLHETQVMAEIGRRFKLHPLVLEDILNTHQRPKIDDYGDYLFIVARFISQDDESNEIGSDQVSMVLGRNFVLTFQERPSGRFDFVRERLRQNRGNIRKLGADYLAYSLLDTVVDYFFSVLENLGERTEALEETMMTQAHPGTLQILHRLKRDVMSLRRSVWPLREVVNSLTRADDRFFRVETRPYLHDVYDHVVHAIESLEATRDMIAGMLDLYLSSVSNRVNLEVRALTVVAVIFMPSTLLSGIFGMNFKQMPLLDMEMGFYLVLGAMLSIALSLGLIFWRRRWLGTRSLKKLQDRLG
ncbi:MAG TPA: magnesium/cobalt transporter CorA [Rhodocyclaceae bacterium]|nr:magnesium/cobalt transporter CorA [Rhodocyclaceae bacterium]